MGLPSLSAALPQLPADKANHFVYGLGLFVALALIRDPLFALALVIAVGVVKELYDKLTCTGTADALDAVATAAGGGVGYLCIWMGAAL